MPNHITNIIKFNSNLKDKIVNEDGFVDFNLLIPMPPDSDTFCRGNLGSEEMKKFGENNWYDWSVANWGTKWNAYEQSLWLTADVCTATFCTAWCYPYKWIETLAKYGDFTLLYADEDMCGSNCGIIECVDGAIYGERSLSDVEQLALSFYVRKCDPKDEVDWLGNNGYSVDSTLEEVYKNYTAILLEILPDGFDLP